MSVLNKTSQLNFSVREALAAIGCVAELDGNRDAAVLALELVNSLDEHGTAPLHVKHDALLAASADWLHQAHADLVPMLERLVAALKQGDNRLIVGSIGYQVKNVAEADDAYERIRKRITTHSRG